MLMIAIGTMPHSYTLRRTFRIKKKIHEVHGLLHKGSFTSGAGVEAWVGLARARARARTRASACARVGEGEGVG